MPSPFPGMDPFIEGQQWRDLHHGMISMIQELLAPNVLPRYVVLVEEDVYLIPARDEGAETRRAKQIIPDAFIVEGQGAAARPTGGSTATLIPIEPVTLTLPPLVEQRQAYLTVRYRETREVVTVIEFLSPTNKGPDGRNEFLRKREEVLQSPAHLVELDLLRGGERLPTVEPLPPGDSYAFVSRVPHRPKAAVYVWPLSHLLPAIPIPLAGEDPDVWLNLQLAFTTVYERAAYAYSLDYRQPVEQPLNETDAAWVRQVVQAAFSPP
jgi:hypothetical protein